MFKFCLIFTLVLIINQEVVDSFFIKPIIDHIFRPITKRPVEIDYLPPQAESPPQDEAPLPSYIENESNEQDESYETREFMKELTFLDPSVINNADSPKVKGSIAKLLEAMNAHKKYGGVNFIGDLNKFLGNSLNGKKLKENDMSLLGDIGQVILITVHKGLSAFFALIGTPFRVVLDCLKTVFKILVFVLATLTLPIRIAIITVLKFFDKSVFESGFKKVLYDLLLLFKIPNIDCNLAGQLFGRLFHNRPLKANHIHDLSLHLFPMVKSNPNGILNALYIFKIPAAIAIEVIIGFFKMVSMVLKPFPNNGKIFANLLQKNDFYSIQNPMSLRNKLNLLGIKN